MEKSNSHKRRFLHSKKIVKKKNFVIMIKVMMIILSLLLVVSCVMGTEPNNNTGTDNGGGIVDNGDNPVVPSDEDKIKAVLKKVKITNDSFNVFKLGEDPSEYELNAIEGEIDTIFEDGNTASAWLGLARKDGDDKLYLIAKDYKGAPNITTTGFVTNVSTLQEDCKRISSDDPSVLIDYQIPVPAGSGNGDLFFGSVKQALEWRWQNMKKGFPDSLGSNPFYFFTGSNPWLTFVTKVANGVSIKAFCFTEVVLFFAAKTDVADPEVYFLNAPDGVSRAVDWTITFIKGGEIYSFKVGPYSIGKGAPIYSCPPIIDDMLDPPHPEGLTVEKHYEKSIYHMFRLSSLVRLSLEKQLMDNGISADIAKEKADAYLLKELGFSKDSGFADLNSWEIYLTIGRIGKANDGTNSLFSWRNTFKLVGAGSSDFWSKCWE